MSFQNKTAVVTGGASGIGYAIAQALLADGANVVIADIEQAALDRAVASLSETSPNVRGVVTDVRSEDALIALREAAVSEFGGVQLLFNNAGVETGGSFESIPEKSWRWVMDVNFFGILNGCRVFLPELEKHEDAHIVNTASVAAFASGTPMMIPYCSSKMAVLGLSESLELELRGRDSSVHLSVLAPGPIKTRMTEAERNRPDDVPAGTEPARIEAMKRLAQLTQEKGMEPADLAQQVLQAIRDKDFFILTHPDIAINGIKTRLNWMETGEPPAPRVAGT